MYPPPPWTQPLEKIAPATSQAILDILEEKLKRPLTDDELRRVWATATAGEGPFAAFVRFLLLTGARRTEVAAMTWDELDGAGGWLLPASRNKAKFDLLRPIGKAAQAVVVGQPRIGDFVFSNGRRPLSGISKHKA